MFVNILRFMLFPKFFPELSFPDIMSCLFIPVCGYMMWNIFKIWDFLVQNFQLSQCNAVRSRLDLKFCTCMNYIPIIKNLCWDTKLTFHFLHNRTRKLGFFKRKWSWKKSIQVWVSSELLFRNYCIVTSTVVYNSAILFNLKI